MSCGGKEEKEEKEVLAFLTGLMRFPGQRCGLHV
jgi:hypothetical protein